MAARYATLASMGRSTTTLRVVAGVLPKLETIAAEELRRLGIAGKTKAFRGGIEFRATEQELWRVAHESRVVEFLRTRVANRSRAHDWGELYHRVVSAPWSAYLQRGKKGRCPRSDECVHVWAVCVCLCVCCEACSQPPQHIFQHFLPPIHACVHTHISRFLFCVRCTCLHLFLARVSACACLWWGLSTVCPSRATLEASCTMKAPCVTA